MNNKELAAHCLIEAASLLEGAASDKRKDILKSEEYNEVKKAYKKFAGNKMSMSEATAFYNKTKRKIAQLKNEANKIPNETGFETVKMILKDAVFSGLCAMTFGTFAGYYAGVKSMQDNDYTNLTKSDVLKRLNGIENNLDVLYKRYKQKHGDD
jgi:hypothetical protein